MEEARPEKRPEVPYLLHLGGKLKETRKERGYCSASSLVLITRYSEKAHYPKVPGKDER
ncbi:MAG: hypothetical protein HXS46_04455 [Theionarchaea archaeon]|nr:hypothetical protein [Theionarchaea archaeon]